jgi:hypothetical protein
VITNKMASNDEIRKPVIAVDSTTTKTATTLVSTFSNETTTENQTQIVKDSRSQYIDDSSLHLLQRDIKMHSQSETSELFNNTISNQTFVVLMLIIGLMSIAILFLIFTNR